MCLIIRVWPVEFQTTGRNVGFTGTSFVNTIIYLEAILLMHHTIVAIRSRHVLLHFCSDHRDSSEKKHRDKERPKLKDGSSDKQKDKYREKKKEERVGRFLCFFHVAIFFSTLNPNGSGGVANSLLWFTQYQVLLLTFLPFSIPFCESLSMANPKKRRRMDLEGKWELLLWWVRIVSFVTQVQYVHFIYLFIYTIPASMAISMCFKGTVHPEF